MLAVTLFLSCAQLQPGLQTKETHPSINALNLITIPVALNLNGVPGPDGFSVKVYASSPSNPKAVRLPADSTLEILMFDGTLTGLTNEPMPRVKWRFTGVDLDNREFTSSLGTGYEFILLWGTNRPLHRLVTIVARHTSKGSSLLSHPSSVTVVDP